MPYYSPSEVQIDKDEKWYWYYYVNNENVC